MTTRWIISGCLFGWMLFMVGCGGDDGQATVDQPKLMPVEEGTDPVGAPDADEASHAIATESTAVAEPVAIDPLAADPLAANSVVGQSDDPTVVIDDDSPATQDPSVDQPPTKEEQKEALIEALQQAIATGDKDAMLASAKRAYDFDNNDPQFKRVYVSLLVDRDKPAEAAAVLEDALKVNPDDLQSSMMLVQVYSMVADASSDDTVTLATVEKAGKLIRSLQTGDAAAALGPQAEMFFSQILFDEARMYSQLKQPDKSLASLRDAFDAGFTELAKLSEEQAFEGLSDREDYQKLVTEYAEKIRLKLREESRQEIIEQEAINFAFELPTLDGVALKSSDLAGKIVLVDFWGTWCPPCRKEIPHLIALQKKYEKDIVVIGLTYPRGPVDLDLENVKDFVAANSMTYPCLIGDDKALADVQIEGFPTLVFIDRAGKVRLKAVGYHSYEKIDSVLEVLMDEKAS